MIGAHRVLHANCFPPASACAREQLLLTDETLVARAWRAPAVASTEDLVDVQCAHDTSVAMQRLAFDWFRVDGEDPSSIDGISAGDLAGHEAAHTILMPAARGALAMASALDHGLRPSVLTSVVPAGEDRYARLETLAADAAMAAVRSRLGASVKIERIACECTGNATLRGKYARTRDVDYLLAHNRRRDAARMLALGLTNAGSGLRRRGAPALLVVEYNPSHAFARAYGARRRRNWRLLCLPATPRDLLAIARRGDAAILPFAPDLRTLPPSGVGERLRARSRELEGATLRVAAVELWPLVREPLLSLAERYGRYVKALAPTLRRAFEQHEVRAVLVPFDTPPHTRLIVRLAQALSIPTFVINDGYKADEIQQEGMTADVALVWSRAMREHYYARRANGAVVTGDPRGERTYRAASASAQSHRERLRGERLRGERLRVLVGGHAFSPVDLNCGRSDAERFLEETLRAIAAAHGRVSEEVLVKLHPSDEAGYYREILAHHPLLKVRMLGQGDVIALLTHYDVYVTTYSTSLLQAVAIGVPVVYYRIGSQRLGPPFSGDEFIAARTASTPAELTMLLCDRDALSTPAPAGWVERYLGPAAGATDRVIASIEERAGSRRPAVTRRKAGVNI